MEKNTYIRRKKAVTYGELSCREHIEMMESFLKFLENRNYSPGSVTRRRGSLRNFLFYLQGNGITRIQDIESKDLEKYRSYLIAEKYSEYSIEALLRSVRLFFCFLAENSFIFENPARDLVIKKPVKKLGLVLTEKEVKRLLNSPNVTIPVGLRDRAMLEILYSTGIRAAELTGMTVSDAVFSDQHIRIKGKGKKERVIPVGKHAAEYIRLYLKNGRDKLVSEEKTNPDTLWMGIRKTPLLAAHICVIVKRHALKAGLPEATDTHTLRRTCATHLLRNGAHPLMVSQLLGHSSMKTLSYYLQISITDLKKTHSETKAGR